MSDIELRIIRIVLCFICGILLYYLVDSIKYKRNVKCINSQNKYNVITLCGSTKFKDEFIEAQKQLTLQGNIVISVGLFGHSGDNEVRTEYIKEMLDDMHKRKIDMSDEIVVINKYDYIGKSTESEINYAKSHGKKITYWFNNEMDVM